MAHRGLHTSAQPFVVLALNFQFVDHHLDVVVLVSVHLHPSRDFENLAIDTDVKVPLVAHALEEFTVVTLALPHQWCEDVDGTAVVTSENHLQHLLFGVFHHLLAGVITIGGAGAGIKQSEKVVNLGGGAYGGAGILVRGFLLDADDWTEPRDFVDIGTLHTAEEIAGVGGESLDVAALAFSIDGVESQRRLART